jgi:hypothetical protein
MCFSQLSTGSARFFEKRVSLPVAIADRVVFVLLPG